MAATSNDSLLKTLFNLCKVQESDLRDTLTMFKPNLRTASMNKSQLVLEVERLLLTADVERVSRHVDSLAYRIEQEASSPPSMNSTDVPEDVTPIEAHVFQPRETAQKLHETRPPMQFAHKVTSLASTHREAYSPMRFVRNVTTQQEVPPSIQFARKGMTPPSTQVVNVQQQSLPSSIGTPFHKQTNRQSPNMSTQPPTRGLLPPTTFTASNRSAQQFTPAPILIKFNIVQSPFYDIQKEVVPLKLLASQKGKPTIHRIDFFIPNEFAANFQGPPSDSLPRYELQMRMVLNKPNEEQFDTFPDGVKIKMNGKEVALPIVARAFGQEAVKSYEPKPLNLTPYLVRNPGTKQQMSFEWKGDKKDFVVGLWIVYHISLEILRDHFLKKGLSQYEETKERVNAKLKGLADEDGLTMDSLKISLLCPITRKKIMTPIRSRNCNHIQCTDLNNYLQMNSMKQFWKCPICSKKTPYDSLAFDLYISEIIQEVDDNVTEVELMADGSWKVADIADDEKTDEIIEMPGNSQQVLVQLEDTVDDQIPEETQQEPIQVEGPVDEVNQVPGEPQQSHVHSEVPVDKQMAEEPKQSPIQPEVPVDKQMAEEPKQSSVQPEAIVEEINQVPEEVQQAHVQPEAIVEERIADEAESAVPRKRKHDKISIDDFDFD